MENDKNEYNWSDIILDLLDEIYPLLNLKHAELKDIKESIKSEKDILKRKQFLISDISGRIFLAVPLKVVDNEVFFRLPYNFDRAGYEWWGPNSLDSNIYVNISLDEENEEKYIVARHFQDLVEKDQDEDGDQGTSQIINLKNDKFGRMVFFPVDQYPFNGNESLYYLYEEPEKLEFERLSDELADILADVLPLYEDSDESELSLFKETTSKEINASEKIRKEQSGGSLPILENVKEEKEEKVWDNRVEDKAEEDRVEDKAEDDRVEDKVEEDKVEDNVEESKVEESKVEESKVEESKVEVEKESKKVEKENKVEEIVETKVKEEKGETVEERETEEKVKEKEVAEEKVEEKEVAEEKEAKVEEKEAKVEEKEVEEKEAKVEEKEAKVEEKEVIEEKEAKVEEKEAKVEEKEAKVEEKEAKVEEKEAKVEEKEAKVEEKEVKVEEKEVEVEEKEAKVEKKEVEDEKEVVEDKVTKVDNSIEERTDTGTETMVDFVLSEQLQDKIELNEGLMEGPNPSKKYIFYPTQIRGYEWLNDNSAYPIKIKDRVFPTVEHYIQFMKFFSGLSKEDKNNKNLLKDVYDSIIKVTAKEARQMVSTNGSLRRFMVNFKDQEWNKQKNKVVYYGRIHKVLSNLSLKERLNRLKSYSINHRVVSMPSNHSKKNWNTILGGSVFYDADENRWYGGVEKDIWELIRDNE